jgi:hypothetical protein
MLVNEKKDVYVNPQMETNSIWKRGFPVWEYPSVPAHFRTGTPHMEMGSVVLATSKSRVEEPHRFQFPYGDHHMETGIDTSPYGKGESPFPYGAR